MGGGEFSVICEQFCQMGALYWAERRVVRLEHTLGVNVTLILR